MKGGPVKSRRDTQLEGRTVLLYEEVDETPREKVLNGRFKDQQQQQQKRRQTGSILTLESGRLDTRDG